VSRQVNLRCFIHAIIGSAMPIDITKSPCAGYTTEASCQVIGSVRAGTAEVSSLFATTIPSSITMFISM
jgi:hypothetical protein